MYNFYYKGFDLFGIYCVYNIVNIVKVYSGKMWKIDVNVNDVDKILIVINKIFI